jgi:para-aminobenzoate synthetase/4-amino-4-deoxychorismate lyase
MPEATPSPRRAHSSPRLLVQSDATEGIGLVWLEFDNPVRIVEATELSAVMPLIEEIEAAADNGLYAAGFVTYEAASAFDQALKTRTPGRLPLAWFGLFSNVRRHRQLPWAVQPTDTLYEWKSSIELPEYRRAIRAIRSAIENGDTYQANFTFRLRTTFEGDPRSLFSRLITAQPVSYAAYVDTGTHVICSASPELFFNLSDDTIVARPMKGTTRRGFTLAEDRKLALALYDSSKNRAENLMIVDMVRNDLGRIATPGSVRVGSLFDLETYESVHQLTSTVTAKTTQPISNILQALFPCASITGAPKVRTMELLADLETTPRGIYTGAIGYVAPDQQAQFNVAIRTVHVDRHLQTAEYGTGGGILWDSGADEEYRECAAKAAILTAERPSFALLETLLWEPGRGFFLLQRHLERLGQSAAYFDFPFDHESVERVVLLSVDSHEENPQRVRLLLSRDGSIRVEQEAIIAPTDTGWQIAMAESAIDCANVFLYHKTTARNVYDRARDSAPGYDDVLLWNADGRLTESTLANLVIERDGRSYTPPAEDGLLAGTFREELVRGGKLAVRKIYRQDLVQCDRIWLINSVRRWIRVNRVDEPGSNGFRTIWRNTVS